MKINDLLVHRLKVWEEYFVALKNGKKTFEIRNESDRQFQCGDLLFLEETISETGKKTGRCLGFRVIYIHRGLGMEKGFCCMSLEPFALD